MVLASQIALVDWSVLLTPFVEFQPAILIWYFVYASDDRQAYDCVSNVTIVLLELEGASSGIPFGPGSF